jgi:hypothetical protein
LQALKDLNAGREVFSLTFSGLWFQIVDLYLNADDGTGLKERKAGGPIALFWQILKEVDCRGSELLGMKR